MSHASQNHSSQNQAPQNQATQGRVFIDSHCHIDAEAFSDLPSLLNTCQAKGVNDIIVPGLYEAQWLQIQQLAAQFSSLHIAFGRHPWWLKPEDSVEIFTEDLLAQASHPSCIAIGETGIDAAKNINLDLQRRWFEAHIQVAAELNKPLIIHAVRSHPHIQELLKKYRGKARGVIHAFSGSAELAGQYWRLGFYLGIGGTITYPRGSKTQQAVKALPLEALLLETDAPDMPLCGRQGEPNQPYFVVEIAQLVAQLRGESLATIAAATSENCRRLFDIR